MKFSKIKTWLLTTVVVMFSISAHAHVWYIGWESNNDGSVDFYGVSYHSGGLGSNENFAANPAGFVINGTNVSFDLGSATNLSDCGGIGAISGSCDATWNALGLDGGIIASGYTSSTYGKYASVNLDTAELLTLGITSGSNSVLLSTFANNVDWQGRNFSSANVPIDLIVQTVPEPATLAILGLGLAGLRLSRRSKK